MITIESKKAKIDTSYIKRYTLLLIFIWSIIVFSLIVWDTIETNEDALDFARTYANAAFQKDIFYRLWNTMHGGVYVPITNMTPANSHLSDIPERDIITPSGVKLTLINPAYMSRQVYELESEYSEVRSRITSLYPIEPKNTPDAWERESLEAFENGEKEVFSIEIMDEREYFRLMRPFITEERCLKCHANQGYAVNDIRGGISISLPMDSIRELTGAVQNRNILMYVLLWFVGICGIVFGYFRVNKSEYKRKQAENELEMANRGLETKVEHRTAKLTLVNEFLKTSEEKNLAFLEAIPDMMFQLSRDGTFLDYMNSTDQKTLVSPDKIIGTNIRDVMPAEITQKAMEYADAALQTGTIQSFEYQLQENGDLNYYEARIVASGVDKVLIIARNVTDRHKAVAEIHKLNEELELHINELRSLDAMKNDFISNVSHELKTPLISIMGYGELMISESLGVINEQQKMAMEVVFRNSKRLKRLIDSLIYLTMENAGNIKFIPTPLKITDVIKRAVLDMHLTVENKNLTITTDMPDELPIIDGNQDRLTEVIVNLIDNAIKFTPSGGEITLKACELADNIHIMVKDTGIGISEEKISKLFDRFYQVDASTTRRYGGTGLGLHIVKKIIEMHNGQIWAESEKGVGTTIHILLHKEQSKT